MPEIISRITTKGPFIWEIADPMDGVEDSLWQPTDETVERITDPLNEQRTLFIEFARLGRDIEAIARFCTQYGNAFGDGIAFKSDIYVTIDRMAAAVELLDALRDARARRVTKYQSTFDLVEREIASVRLNPDPAWAADGSMSFRLVIENLKHVLWFQLAQAINEGRQYRDCEHCGKPFELAPGENRADKLFHSDTCRAKHNYHAKKKALAMKAKGKTIDQITKAVGYDESIVRRWLKPKKGKGR